jgi:hypothetical protein
MSDVNRYPEVAFVVMLKGYKKIGYDRSGVNDEQTACTGLFHKGPDSGYFVITAGHCVKGWLGQGSGGIVTAEFPKIKISKYAPAMVPVQAAAITKDYREGEVTHDIALLRLSDDDGLELFLDPIIKYMKEHHLTNSSISDYRPLPHLCLRRANCYGRVANGTLTKEVQARQAIFAYYGMPQFGWGLYSLFGSFAHPGDSGGPIWIDRGFVGLISHHVTKTTPLSFVETSCGQKILRLTAKKNHYTGAASFRDNWNFIVSGISTGTFETFRDWGYAKGHALYSYNDDLMPVRQGPAWR